MISLISFTKSTFSNGECSGSNTGGSAIWSTASKRRDTWCTLLDDAHYYYRRNNIWWWKWISLTIKNVGGIHYINSCYWPVRDDIPSPRRTIITILKFLRLSWWSLLYLVLDLTSSCRSRRVLHSWSHWNTRCSQGYRSVFWCPLLHTSTHVEEPYRTSHRRCSDANTC